MNRRLYLKIIHWLMLPLLIWFILMTPADVVPMGIFTLHSNLALLFVVISIIWTIDLIWRGLATKRTPKLTKAQHRFHQILHKTIIYGLFGVAFTGFLLGLTANRLFKAGGFLPFAPPLDLPKAHDIVGQIHIYEFYALALIIAVHAAFHIWRHYKLHDNALRIMMPKWLHKFL